ncbi:branched-chain amino acid transport system permease protein [Rhodoligotrophos appendicifer]|uniref:branched-chain amino acid ABC transporter permease n=1 Tax=Rhodoligotrophos appendicifer TaxID=987056 RepID=UPI0011849C1C|nr:branched-chain amino acid ABC transporter permease [Rhodoligotrophos appendicifer]
MKAAKILALVAAALAFATLPLWADQGIMFLAGLVLIEAVFALSWNLLFGFTGLASFGHAAFFAIGAYLTGYALRTALGVPFLLLIMGSGILGAAVAVLTGLVLLRRTTGIHLAIFTLALAEVLRIIIGYSTVLGREDGLASIPRPALDFGFATINLASGTAYYWFLCVAASLLAGLLWLVCHGPFGRVLVSIRQDPERAAFMGVNVPAYRLLAFTISGGVAAMSGALYAPWAQIVTPESAHWIHSTQPMLASLLGGAHSFYGPIIGTVLFSVINYLTRDLVGLAELVIGLILLVIVLAAPNGVVGLLQAAWRRATRSSRTPEAMPQSVGDAT